MKLVHSRNPLYFCGDKRKIVLSDTEEYNCPRCKKREQKRLELLMRLEANRQQAEIAEEEKQQTQREEVKQDVQE